MPPLRLCVELVYKSYRRRRWS